MLLSNSSPVIDVICFGYLLQVSYCYKSPQLPHSRFQPMSSDRCSCMGDTAAGLARGLHPTSSLSWKFRNVQYLYLLMIVSAQLEGLHELSIHSKTSPSTICIGLENASAGHWKFFVSNLITCGGDPSSQLFQAVGEPIKGSFSGEKNQLGVQLEPWMIKSLTRSKSVFHSHWWDITRHTSYKREGAVLEIRSVDATTSSDGSNTDLQRLFAAWPFTEFE